MATKLNHIQQHLFAGLKKINVTEFQKTLLDVYEIEISEREIETYIKVFKDECNIKNSKELSEYILIYEICSDRDTCNIDKLNDYSHELKLMYQSKLSQVETLEAQLNKAKKDNQELQNFYKESKNLSDDRLGYIKEVKEKFAEEEFQYECTIDTLKDRIAKYRNRLFFSLCSIVSLIVVLLVVIFNM